MAKEIILPFSELKGTLVDTPNVPTLEITENGVYNVKGYSYADVNVEGGSPSWNTVFDDSVTTVKELEDDPVAMAEIVGLAPISKNEIKVTFNNVEYNCEKNTDDSYGAIFDESTQTFDWSEYPFRIAKDPSGGSVFLMTQTAGTYTLKIEEPQGGDSDFSTAEVTINITATSYTPIAIVNNAIREVSITETGTYTVPLYKGVAILPLPDGLSVPPSFTGDIELSIEDMGVKVTGNGSITLVGSVS